MNEEQAKDNIHPMPPGERALLIRIARDAYDLTGQIARSADIMMSPEYEDIVKDSTALHDLAGAYLWPDGDDFDNHPGNETGIAVVEAELVQTDKARRDIDEWIAVRARHATEVANSSSTKGVS